MRALEVITGFVTAPDTTLTALTMATGDSLTVRNSPPGKDIWLLNAWAQNQAAGVLQITSPFLADNVQGIHSGIIVDSPVPILPLSTLQVLHPQDTLGVKLSGSATGGDIETACLLLHYADLPGINADLRGVSDVLGSVVNYLTVQNTLALGTAGGYSGSEALNAESDLLKANTDYAILGYTVSAQCAVVGYRAASFGNLRIGGPGNVSKPEMTANWFMELSVRSGLPLIPVFNSADIENVLIDGAQDEDGVDVLVTTILAQLTTP